MLQLVWVTLHHQRAVGQLGAHLNVVDVELVPNQLDGLVDGGLQIEEFHPLLVDTAEHSKVVDDVAHPFGLLRDALQFFFHEVRIQRALLPADQRVFRGHLDDVQGLVQPMGDAGRHLAEGGQLGRL